MDDISHTPEDLHFLGKRLRQITPALKASQNVLERLHTLLSRPCAENNINIGRELGAGLAFSQQADIFTNQLISSANRAEAVLREHESTASLLVQIISAKNQRVTQEQNALVMKLTRSTLDDSVNVRVITVITLVYLSAAVVAVCTMPEYMMDQSLTASRP